jgi:methanogenic corrinoid protein MtbC1
VYIGNNALQLAECGHLIRDLRARLPKPRVLIGGAAFRGKPDLWADIGADGFAPDLHAAVEVADRLCRCPT